MPSWSRTTTPRRRRRLPSWNRYQTPISMTGICIEQSLKAVILVNISKMLLSLKASYCARITERITEPVVSRNALWFLANREVDRCAIVVTRCD